MVHSFRAHHIAPECLRFCHRSSFGDGHLKVLHIAIEYQVNVAKITFLVDYVADIITILDDGINKPSISDPFALLRARIVTEEPDNIVVLEVTCLESEDSLDVCAYRCFEKGIKSVLRHR